MRVYIRAFTENGFYKDICVLSDQQIHMINGEIDEACSECIASGLIGVCAGIDPKDFHEITKFYVVVQK